MDTILIKFRRGSFWVLCTRQIEEIRAVAGLFRKYGKEEKEVLSHYEYNDFVSGV